jgi:predicted Zn-dependent protease
MAKINRVFPLLLLLSTLLQAQEPTRFKPGFNLFSKEQDIQLGQESAAQVRKQMPIVNDPFLKNYVNQIGKRLAASQEAQASGFPFTFEVVADPSINAFALPGGPMFINTGLLKAVDNSYSFLRCWDRKWPAATCWDSSRNWVSDWELIACC